MLVMVINKRMTKPLKHGAAVAGDGKRYECILPSRRLWLVKGRRDVVF